MKWFILFVGIVVLCFVVALILGLAGGGLGRNTTSLSHEPLPDEPIRDTDFDDLVFDVGARGYRMSQVDGVVDRLRRELREKDEEIAVLRGDTPAEMVQPAEPTEPAVGQGEAAEPAEEGLEPMPERGEPAEEPEPPEQSHPTVGRERTT
ncbi:cell division protein DivIVA [Terrabacter sp. Ter38]|uniref:cell division protein DivIVA n=1 Tax=Terrabacter sp. Ter38 TaxID=2926030 RepID=UPI002117F5FC|nr:cell division protein DivIVA [Terrabacter sp. Ter38]